MLKQHEIAAVLEEALREKGDFAELFLEDTEETQISEREGVTQGIKSVRTYGAGLYLLSGVHSIYVYSNEVTLESLKRLAQNAAELLAVEKRSSTAPEYLGRSKWGNPVFQKKETVPGLYDQKIKRMLEADRAVRSMNGLQKLSINYFDTDQRICIANSEGLLTEDRRRTARMRYEMTAGDGIRNISRWEDLYRPGDFSTFIQKDEHLSFGKDLLHRLLVTRDAEPVKPCKVPVILEAGVCGTLFHECCGHMLEGCAIAGKRSPFCDMLGETVASEKVTLADDGTVDGAVGSSKIDDEGHPRQNNILIENGILKNYMTDRLSGRVLGTGSNGCGRRQNYTYAPTSRMSNTYLLSGKDDEDAMLRDIDEGLYVKTVGGGVGGAQFSIAVADGYWIKNGEITHPVKGIALTGAGMDIMKKIDRVGKSLGSFDGSFCGAASGLIPTTVNQPRIRIAEVNLG